MMLNLKKLSAALALSVMLFATNSCSDKKSYADLLNDEHHAVNYYLAQHRVINDIPEDSVFEYGPDAPYYRLEPEGNVYMQVIKPGTKTNRAADDQLIYFRYTRYNLTQYMTTGEWVGDGNSLNMAGSPTSFRYNNYTLSSSTAYGTAVQMPLNYLGIDCEVNLVVKSQYGITSEIASVVPFMYNLRYFKSPL